MRHAVTGLLLILAAGPLAGCGGSGGLVPNPGEIIADIFEGAFPQPVRALQGSLGNDGATDPDGPLLVGDDADDRSWRAFMSFQVVVPDGATLESAELRLHLGQEEGDPFGLLGLFFAERIDMGPTLDAADFTATARQSTIGLTSLARGPNNVDVTTLVEDALARGITRVDIRLRFGVAVVFDKVASLLRFTSLSFDTDPTSLPPTLSLRWRR
ncbi:MAG: hypothetical protein QNJ98_02550 [Planctomycetota bacterium]|nr:hypothetical protein [Planctomycetota bacterium]